MTQGEEIDVAALVEQAQTVVQGHRCWAVRMPESHPEAFRRYVSMLEELNASGKVINRTQVKRTLSSEFGLTLSREAVSRHFRGECLCGKG